MRAAGEVSRGSGTGEAARVSRMGILGKAVPGFGDPWAQLFILGLAPAAHGAIGRGACSRETGAGFLYAALHKAGFANQATSLHRDDGLKLKNAYIAAAVRCAPPGNKPELQEI